MDRNALPVASHRVDAEPALELLLLELQCIESDAVGGARVYALSAFQAELLLAQIDAALTRLHRGSSRVDSSSAHPHDR
jgi:hypothetical protein